MDASAEAIVLEELQWTTQEQSNASLPSQRFSFRLARWLEG
jgi:hypothetical protein